MDEKTRVQLWPLIADTVVGRYAIFSLYESSRRSPRTGNSHRFLRLEAPDWVNVLAFTLDNELILVRQYRHGRDEISLEIPGGAVDNDETPQAAARRELEEETGYRATSVELLGVVDANPAFLSNRCWTFLALECTPDGALAPDSGEELEVIVTHPAELGRMIDRGVIRHSLVVAAHDHLQRALGRRDPKVAAVVPLFERPSSLERG
jgi:ADP-ribose pyrophosphatase